MVGRYWKESDLRSAQAFRRAMLVLEARADIAYRRNNRVELDFIIAALEAAQPYAIGEAMRNSYRHGFCIINLLVALSFAATGQHAEVYEIAEGIMALLRTCDRERELTGQPRRAASEVRYLLLNVLGDTKWQGSDADRDRVMSPEEMCVAWPDVYHRAMANANGRYVDDPARIAAVHQSLGWAGLQVIKCATRYCPVGVPRLVGTFNQWYTPLLAVSEGNWRSKKPLAPHSVWYWDYELCKSFLASTLTRESLDELYLRKEEARRLAATGAEQDVAAYYTAIENEYKFLKSGCKIEVIDRAS